MSGAKNCKLYYSFMPLDRRFDDSPFFLSDFNKKDDKETLGIPVLWLINNDKVKLTWGKDILSLG